ncbi:MAG: 23S rRNA (adenine(2030)-N(6))-methyltransferase RlmJ [Steroidobacteraceae bacterium]
MKYRHAYHAGNFADVHKHVTLLALLGALQRKDKGVFYLDTHAGRGVYDLSTPAAESAAGVGRFQQGVSSAPELQQYAAALGTFRALHGNAQRYPGSPLLAARELRPQDRAVCIELLGAEVNALAQALAASGGDAAGRVRIERGDGFALLRAQLPPAERRGLTFIDPPYEERDDFERLTAAVAEGLRRFPTGVFAAWYPIKDARDAGAWLGAYATVVTAPTLVSELWLYPRDSRVALNGSGLLVTNPPYRIAERMRVWLPELQSRLAVEAGAGSLVRML